MYGWFGIACRSVLCVNEKCAEDHFSCVHGTEHNRSIRCERMLNFDGLHKDVSAIRATHKKNALNTKKKKTKLVPRLSMRTL